MKYKVVDWTEIDAQTLQKMLDETYQEGYQDGYHKGVRESTLHTTTPNYNYDRYNTYEITCSNSECHCEY